MPDKRYADLPAITRAFLEELDEVQVSELLNAAKFYARLSSDARAVLIASKPKTLAWLRDLREEEIEEVQQALSMLRTMRALGKFGKWALITLVGSFVMAAQFGDSVVKLWHWLTARPGA